MIRITVKSANVLTESRRNAIISQLAVKYGDLAAVVEFLVDDALIGGIVISDGNKVLDCSVLSRLQSASDVAGILPNSEPAHNNELKHITEEIKDQLKKNQSKNVNVDAGRIISVGDGVIFIEGLRSAKNGELLHITGDHYAMAMNLDEKGVGAILLTGTTSVRAGDIAKATGHIFSVPVGDAMLGRIVNPLGTPIDGLGDIATAAFRKVEAAAPAIFDRAKVNEPLYTGIKAIDSMVPIGKGQRELIIGDRQTGKTAIALDAIINQKGKDVICIYVAIGQKTSTVAEVIAQLKNNGAQPYTVVVSATAGMSAPLQYLAPYTATAIAEEFMYAGKDVLIVYDDLSKHAVAYRAISLLLKRPAGREAYPGDVFFIHSRLLERSAKLSSEKGGGSITALPIIETLGGDITSYIPTNVISITDGQIFLESELFHAGTRPAINVGLSVSRVGGSAQCSAMRKASCGLKLDLARYREMAVFMQFGADIDSSTRAVLGKGARLTEILKQNQYKPEEMPNQVISIYVMMHELFDEIPVEKINKTMNTFLRYLAAERKDIIEVISKTGALSEDTMRQIESALAKFKESL